MFNIVFLSLGAFALGVDAYIMAGLLPDIAATYAVSPSGAGQTVSIFTVCYAISAPVFGALTAGKPARRVLILALLVFTAANVLSAIAPTYTWLLLARAMAGAGAGLYTPSAVSAAAALVSADRRGRALGMIIGGLALGTAVGVPFGLMLAENAGWRFAMWLIVALGAVALLGIMLRLPDVPIAKPASLKQRLAMFADRRVGATVAVSFIVAVGSIGLYTYVATIFHVEAGVDNVLAYLWAWSVGGLGGTYLAGVVIDKTGRPERVMAAMIAAMAVTYFVLIWGFKYPPVAMICFLVWGAAAWGAQTPQQHRLLSLQPLHGGAAVGLHSSAHYLGSATGAALGGAALAAGLPVAGLPVLAALLLVLALLMQVRIVRGAS